MTNDAKTILSRSNSAPLGTIVAGSLLTLLTIVIIIAKGRIGSPTVFIPLGFGTVLETLGVASFAAPAARKHFMHAAAAISLIGGLVSLVQGILLTRKVMLGLENDALKVGMVFGMAIICITLLGICVQSFVQARRARQSSAT